MPNSTPKRSGPISTPPWKTVRGMSRALCGSGNVSHPRSRPRATSTRIATAAARIAGDNGAASPDRPQRTADVETPPASKPIEKTTYLVVSRPRPRPTGGISTFALLRLHMEPESEYPATRPNVAHNAVGDRVPRATDTPTASTASGTIGWTAEVGRSRETLCATPGRDRTRLHPG